MGEDVKEKVDTESDEFNEGVEAGLNSDEDTKNWKAGNELGQALKEEGETSVPVEAARFGEPATPLFLRDSSDGNKGDAQDEKDATGE
ncbi:MAG TPA: hypothetical protein VFX96_17535 [Pyrinomonadaceae bacterium]|nr:hypothetical protein [Pyrinomonadaceae bacterium]